MNAEFLLEMEIKMTDEQDERISETVQAEKKRLLGFIRSRIPDPEEAEDVLQDVFYELVETYRLMKPVERLSAWLFTTARNKITDLFRKKKPVAFSRQYPIADPLVDEESFSLHDLLPDPDDGPEMLLFREVIREEIEKALLEIPEKHRLVFIQTELEGKSFKEISEKTGLPVNTLISRKRYAILILRERLQDLYDEFYN